MLTPDSRVLPRLASRWHLLTPWLGSSCCSLYGIRNCKKVSGSYCISIRVNMVSETRDLGRWCGSVALNMKTDFRVGLIDLSWGKRREGKKKERKGRTGGTDGDTEKGKKRFLYSVYRIHENPQKINFCFMEALLKVNGWNSRNPNSFLYDPFNIIFSTCTFLKDFPTAM